MDRRYRSRYLDRNSVELFSTCTICHEHLEDPIRTPCDHLFCRACLIEHLRIHSTRCPECYRFVSIESLSPISSAMQTLFDRIPMKCNICGQRGIHRKDFPDHIDYYCPCALVPCPSADVQCPWIGERYKLDCHLLACPFRACRSTLEQAFDENRQLRGERRKALSQVEHVENENKLQRNQITRLSEQLHEQKSEIDVLRVQMQGLIKQVDDNEKKKYVSNEPLSAEEEAYYEKWKRYFHITNTPLISISDEILDENAVLTPILKFAIDQNYDEFNLNEFLEKICNILNIKKNEIDVKKIQPSRLILETEICKNINSQKENIKIICKSITNKAKEELAKLKVFFMFMGDVNSINKEQKFRNSIALHPKWNRIYTRGKIYWEGPLNDGKDRGNQPYFCPVGWKRYALCVGDGDNFKDKFKGWCICYHGTKFQFGLSILFSGFKPATAAEHGAGIYATPSIIYACHPRYAEVKKLTTADEKEFCKSGEYVQFVFECRVHPKNIKIINKETLSAGETPIDPNIKNSVIEWVIDHHGKEIVDFSDSDASMVCTGLMVRVTDNHPGLLPDSDWWFKSHLCNNKSCCCSGIDLDILKKLKADSTDCKIIYH